MRAAFLTVLIFALAACAQVPVSTAPPQPLYSFDLLNPGKPDENSAAAFGTYNLHNRADRDGLAADIRALPFVNTWVFQEFNISSADLQEWNGEHATEARKPLSDLLPPGRWRGSLMPCNFDGKTWECQVIASRFQVAGAETFELEHADPKRRAALVVWLTLEGMTQVRVINSDHETALFRLGPRDRAKQLQSLAAYLHSHATREPTVLLGDFNTSGNWLQGYSSIAEIQETNRILASCGLNPAPLPPTPTFHWWPASLQLDHIFGGDVRFISAGVFSGKGSDHLPVWCSIDLYKQ